MRAWNGGIYGSKYLSCPVSPIRKSTSCLMPGRNIILQAEHLEIPGSQEPGGNQRNPTLLMIWKTWSKSNKKNEHNEPPEIIRLSLFWTSFSSSFSSFSSSFLRRRLSLTLSWKNCCWRNCWKSCYYCCSILRYVRCWDNTIGTIPSLPV